MKFVSMLIQALRCLTPSTFYVTITYHICKLSRINKGGDCDV